MEEITKKIIGRLEYVDLPEFGLSGIIGKVDTGAYSGAIHTSHVIEKEVDGKAVIEFRLLDEDHPEFKEVVYQADGFEKKLIKNSNGDSELRYIIKTKVVLQGKEIRAKFSLSNRKNLKYPILLGRKIIRKNLILDVSKTFPN